MKCDVSGAMSSRAGPQRRQRDRDDVDPVVEVLAELALRDELRQVAVGGGDDAHVDGRLVVAADPADDLLLDRPQELDLHGRRRLADLVEEERAAVGLLEEAALLAHRAGEGAALVAEELGLEQRLRQRAAVDRDELAVLADRGEVDRAGDQLLARAALARQQDRRGHLADPLDRPEDLLHPAAPADDVGERVLAAPAPGAGTGSRPGAASPRGPGARRGRARRC